MTPRPRFWIALVVAALALGLGLYAARQSANWAHFARSGAVLVILGAVLTAWDSLAAGGGPLAEVRRVLSRERKPSETLGLTMMVVGTLIWAFGDLVRYAAP